jgi:putative membrane protein
VKTLAAVLTALVALEHLGFLGLEMFAWTLPVGQAAFHTTPEFAVATAALAANQGLYNGFLAAGLAFALWRREVALRLFFLGCVVVAGVFGAATAFVDILFVQALPAALAFAATLAVGKRPAPGWRAQAARPVVFAHPHRRTSRCGRRRRGIQTHPFHRLRAARARCSTLPAGLILRRSRFKAELRSSPRGSKEWKSKAPPYCTLWLD